MAGDCPVRAAQGRARDVGRADGEGAWDVRGAWLAVRRRGNGRRVWRGRRMGGRRKGKVGRGRWWWFRGQ